MDHSSNLFEIEILTTQSDDEIKTISQSYQQNYDNTLEADLRGDTSGNFQKLCISLVQGNRNENPVNLLKDIQFFKMLILWIYSMPIKLLL